jgi:hypothetical protein
MTIYTPRLSAASLCRLRRLAWFAQRPMAQTLDRLIELVCRRIDPRPVCDACRDRTKCDICGLADPGND